MNTATGTRIRNLRRICFREYGEAPHPEDNLPSGVDEHYDLDLWFEFEADCLFFCHNDLSFRRVAAPPADAAAIPTTPDEQETACLPASFVGASLLDITASRTPGFILRFDNGGIIELVPELHAPGEEGAASPCLSPRFHSATALAAEEDAAIRAYLEGELADSGGRKLPELPEETATSAPEAGKEWENNATPAETCAQVADFVNDATPRERETLHRVLWSGECVRWATRPLLHRWNNTSLTHFVLGLLWTAWCAFVFCSSRGQSAEATTDAATTAFFLSTLPFWGVGAWLLLSPWRQPGRLRKTLYIITNKRAIVLESGLFSRNVQSWELAKNMVVSRDHLSGDRGRLLFCDNPQANHHSRRHGGFLYLGNMARAEKELRRALEARRNHRKR